MKKPDEYEILERAHEAAGAHMMQQSPRADELIACLEGEIAKRDARIVELDDLVLSLQCKAIESDDLRAELAAIKAQEPAAWKCRHSAGEKWFIGDKPGYWECVPLYAAPVSEAKAQGVVMPDNLLSHRVTWRQAFVRLIELEDVADPETGRDDKAYWQHELRAFDDMYADLDRLNAAPVQQVSVPDGWKLVPDHADADAIVTALYRRFKDWAKQGFGPEDVTWCEVKADILAMLSAAPAAPAADAGLVEALKQAFPLFDEDGLNELYHHCEIAVLGDRKRLHKLLAAHRAKGVV